MAKLVHSFWTRPSMSERWGYRCEQIFYNLWYFALSVAYSKRVGAPIVLHTDTLGERLFGHLPYDEIHLTLDDMDAPYRFWAAGKFYAMQAEDDLRAIHIDGDVFIKKPELWERLTNSKGDILVQCREDWQDAQAHTLSKYISGDFLDHDCMLNTGVLGIFNRELKDSIISEYMRVLRDAKQNIPEEVLHTGGLESPDLVCEQQMIAHKSQGYNVDLLLNWRNMSEASAMGYQHVLSSQKFQALERCKAVLKSVNTDIYNKTKKICQNL